MIKNLQIKFVLIIMSIMTVVLLCIFGAINATMYRSTNQQTNQTLHQIAENNGFMKGGILRPPTERLPNPYTVAAPQRNFSVRLSEDNSILEVISSKDQNYTVQDVVEYVNDALGSGENSGHTGTFKFLIREKPYGKIVVFLDDSLQLNATVRLLWITVSVGMIGWVVILGIAIYLSNWAIKPVKKAYEAQKRFVADASHELKTPLTIISANVDILSSDFGENKWLQFIKTETARMGELITNLLYLAKSDASETMYSMCEFDLSNAVTGVVLPFESICYESQKILTLDIKENIRHKGDMHRLMQVVVILLDNAIKNTHENGEITVSLAQIGNKKILTVYNTGTGLSEEEKTKIFERFYRVDNSRARQTGSYGLGLSIAKAIVEAHKGKLLVESKKGEWAKFLMVLS